MLALEILAKVEIELRLESIKEELNSINAKSIIYTTKTTNRYL